MFISLPGGKIGINISISKTVNRLFRITNQKNGARVAVNIVKRRSLHIYAAEYIKLTLVSILKFINHRHWIDIPDPRCQQKSIGSVQRFIKRITQIGNKIIK